MAKILGTQRFARVWGPPLLSAHPYPFQGWTGSARRGEHAVRSRGSRGVGFRLRWSISIVSFHARAVRYMPQTESPLYGRLSEVLLRRAVPQTCRWSFCSSFADTYGAGHSYQWKLQIPAPLLSMRARHASWCFTKSSKSLMQRSLSGADRSALEHMRRNAL